MTPDGDAKQRQQWKAALATTADCLTLEDLGRWADGSLSDAEKSRASSHLAGCARCQTELTMLQEFERAIPRPEEQTAVSWIAAEIKRRSSELAPATEDVSRSPPSSARRGSGHRISKVRRISATALSLAAMVTAVVVGLSVRTGKQPALISDGVTGSPVLRSEGVVALAPIGDLIQSPAELRWQPLPGAARYSIKLMEVDRSELWETSSEQTAVVLPAAVREKVVPGKTLLWQVTALDGAGKVLASSPIERFRLPTPPRSNP
jgi:hypothetical protein